MHFARRQPLKTFCDGYTLPPYDDHLCALTSLANRVPPPTKNVMPLPCNAPCFFDGIKKKKKTRDVTGLKTTPGCRQIASAHHANLPCNHPQFRLIGGSLLNRNSSTPHSSQSCLIPFSCAGIVSSRSARSWSQS